MRTRTYICGAISGLDYADRYARFERAEEEVFRSGEIPVNPMKNGLPRTADWHEQMVVDRRLLTTCQKMVVLPYYEHSRGCAEEITWAQNLGIEIIYLSRDGEPAPKKEQYDPFDRM